MKISVCLTTYNGELFLKQQLDSIINQLPINGEIIISDDGSIDQTLNLLETFSQKEPRIKLFKNNFKSVKKNFEFTLKQCTGDYIFLSDQDDIWKQDKIETTLIYFSNGYDLVLSDCFIINSDNIIVNNSFFALNNSSSGFLKNIYRNSYIGCCMAFKRNILD
jgi:glycosyltransferase involved in cell wall biosynthesis